MSNARLNRSLRRVEALLRNGELVTAWAESEQMDHQASYLRRGRRFACLDGRELQNRWEAAFRRCGEAALKGGAGPQRWEEHDDLEAEFALRNLEPDRSDTNELIARLVAYVREGLPEAALQRIRDDLCAFARRFCEETQ